MVQQMRFTGLMDLDSRDDIIAPGWHKYATNVRFYGNKGNMSVQNVPGNVLVSNSSLPSGTNVCIGGFYDPVKKRVIYFNYNSNGRNGIYSYDFSNDTITKIFLCFTDSATDILAFDPNYPVHSAAIVYRTTTDGDLLYWTDETNRPRYLNIDTIQTLIPFTEDMINAAKNAPLLPPTVLYQDDTTVNVNNLRKQLFEFCYRWKYKNLEYSTTSPYSKLALPINFSDVDTQNDPNKNNNIGITFQTGGADFDGVEILGRVSLGQNFGDWFSIVSLDRGTYGYSPSTNYTFDFYNDGAYTTVDPKQTNLYFSYLPDKANTLETLNGNVIIYGGITDGYPATIRTDINVTVTSGLSGGSGVPSISFVYSGAYKIIVNIGATVTVGTTYNISMDYFDGTNNHVINQNVVAGGLDNQDSITTTFELDFVGFGFPGLSAQNLGGGVLEITTSNLTGSFANVSVSVSTAGSENSSASWKWGCQERLGIIYFDDRGKTNGVISWLGASIDSNDFGVATPDLSVLSNVIQIPYLSASISHDPPTWAVSYQWVRVPLTPKFLHWITNDYQTDTDFLYFCIQNLTYTQSKTSGYVPSYEFVKGDRIRVLAKFDSATGFYTPYNLQLDMEILGTVERTMTSPASTGTFIKVAKPVTFPSLAYSKNILIELYTPYLRVSDTQQLFFEWGERYAIYTSSGTRYHRGQVTDQTAIQPATFKWFDGDIYFKNRTFYLDVNATTATTAFMMDANFNDYFPSAVNSNGRAWVIDPNAATIYRANQFRWGQSYQQDTSINQLNIFYANDFDTCDLAKGAIRRLKVRDRILRVFQERGCGQLGVYSKFIQDSGNTNILETSDTIITTNNIQYYSGEYGLGTQPCGLVSGKIQDYFVDPVRGYQCRLSGDGIVPISELYKGQFTIRDLLTPYNNVIANSTSVTKFIMGAYNYFDEEYITVLPGGHITNSELRVAESDALSSQTWNLSFRGIPQAGDIVTVIAHDGTNNQTFSYTCIAGETTQTLSAALVALINGTSTHFTADIHTFILLYGLRIHSLIGVLTVTASVTYGTTLSQYAFSFNETRNGYCTFFDYKTAEWITNCEDLIITFVGGNLYRHNSSTYCNFYGVQYNCDIQVPFNQNLLEKKTWLSHTQITNDGNVWTCPSIYTNSQSYGTQRQESLLIDGDFTVFEGNPSASFLRDTNSINGILNGDELKGNLVVITFRKVNASSLINLNEVAVLTRDSPLTSR